MSNPLDNRTLGVISEMIENGQTASVPVVRKLWKDRALLLDAAIRIRDWDAMHSEALNVSIAQAILAEALESIDE